MSCVTCEPKSTIRTLSCIPSAPNPKFARQCRKSDRELRVQRGTRTLELPVAFDSEVRMRVCREGWRTSESGHWPGRTGANEAGIDGRSVSLCGGRAAAGQGRDDPLCMAPT